MTFMKSLDVIFCCNVLIYFDLASKRRVIQHFYNNLLPHGYLFLGHSESLYGVTDDFRLVHLPGPRPTSKANALEAGKRNMTPQPRKQHCSAGWRICNRSQPFRQCWRLCSAIWNSQSSNSMCRRSPT